ncbi:hypothetical protein ASG52_19750 [Methylobacterium sp. Leaf456]|uniref:hypothetical protein n=1 Tax=Methylobacterium sp. Leaf456 TaxID=1736382 RepID=UPI0006F4D4DC|nr:hypothetical protein [Methylobacterium sp. Leaf456]KQT59962.1 hypothetical protein ASG52_19750 [Methylobacterium sp. Leaf456]
MLSASDLADFDLSGLSSGLQSMVVRQDRYRREAVSIGVRPDCPETYSLVQAAERDAAVLAELERLVLTVRLFAADENAARPAPASPSAGSLVARALAAISGAPPARHCRTLIRETSPTRGAI